ncbi:MAG: FtsX-like permease family protein [Clostridia bacterium]|nr:FtsX-like permease family protein [Clostridia bacterium]
MKKTLLKDTLRSISANKLRFLSVIIIVALGISFFVGIKSSSPAMGYSANEYFRINNLLDVRVTSRVAFSEDDIKKIENLDNVDYVVRSKYVDAVVSVGDSSVVDASGTQLTCRISPVDVDAARAFSETGQADDSYVNRLVLKEGRYPEKAGECVIDAGAVKNYANLEIGSVITLSGDEASITDSLRTEELTVVGTVDSPMYISTERGTTQVGSGALSCFAFVSESDFSTNEINELFVKVKYDDVYDKFSDEYKEIVTTLSDEIEEMSSGIIDSKLSVLKVEYEDKISAKQKEIENYNKSSADELTAKQKEIDEFKAYVDSEDEILTNSKQKIENEKASYKSSLDRLNSEFNTLNATYESNVKTYEGQSSEIKGYTDLKNLYDELNLKHTADKIKLGELEAAKNAAQSDYDYKKSSLDIAKSNVTYYENRLSNLASEISKLKSEISSLELERKELQNSVAVLESEIKTLEKRIEELDKKYSGGTITSLERIELLNSRTQLSSKTNELSSSNSRIKEIGTQIPKKEASISTKTTEQTDASTSLSKAKDAVTLANSELNAALSALNSAKSSYDSFKSSYDADTATLNKYTASMNQLTSGQGKLTELADTISKQETELEALKKRLTEAQIRYSLSVRNGSVTLQKAQYDLDNAKTRYYTIDNELTELKTKIAEKKTNLNGDLKKLRNTLKNIDSITWTATAQSALTGHSAFESSMDNILSMSDIFPIIFLVTAMIACFVIMMKNVEEERGSIGLLKAFGYSNFVITGKYVSYALLAWLGGAFLGGVLGTCIVPSAVYSIFDIIYTVPNVGAVFNFKYISLGLGISFVTTMAATFMAVVRELKMYPAALMRPKMVGYNRRSLLERMPEFWNSLPYGIVLLIRTIIRSRKRVAVGSVAIACCTALILSSFGLFNSVTDVSDSQYGDDGIFNYDVQFVLNAEQNPSDSAVLNSVREDKLVNSAMLISNNSMTVSSVAGGSSIEGVHVVVPSEMENIADYINLDIIEGSANLNEGGVVLSQKLAQSLDAVPGDIIYFTDANEIVHPITVIGVVKNYIGHYAYVSPEAYEEVFLAEPEYKYLLCSLKDYMDDDEIADFSAGYLKTEDVAGVATAETMSRSADNAIRQVMVLVVLFVLSACLLAMIVMYTTSNVNISERTHEIANIKVIGFSDSEVLLYVIRENLISTVIGTVIGLIGGVFLHNALVNLISVENIMYGTSVSWWSFIVATLIIVSVAVVASLPILFKINKVDMAQELKSIE